jgi:hypothetical protein
MNGVCTPAHLFFKKTRSFRYKEIEREIFPSDAQQLKLQAEG